MDVGLMTRGQKPMNENKLINVSKIDPNPYQTRLTYNAESMEELKTSIKQLGIVTPLVVRPIGDRFQLVSGSRRLLAAQELGLKEVPAIVKELSDKEVMEITITENLQREDLNAIEEALGFQKLLEEFNYTHEKLAERLGKSRSYITNSLRLLKLNWVVKLDVLHKTITPWHARCLLSLEEYEQYVFANLIMDWNLSVEETRENVKKFLNGEWCLIWQREIPIDAIKTERPLRLFEIDETLEIEGLSQSIKELGLLNPIKVMVNGDLLDGHTIQALSHALCNRLP
jgi:ParB/RepB/Spo0J family partition protein